MKKVFKMFVALMVVFGVTACEISFGPQPTPDNPDEPTAGEPTKPVDTEPVDPQPSQPVVPTESVDPNAELKINVPEDRALKIAQFADLHFGIEGKDWHNDKVERTLEYMDYVVETTQPDLIVCSGDNILDTGVEKLKDFIAKMESYQIPWTFIYGNHDAESGKAGYSKAELSQTLQAGNTKYLLYKEGYVEEGTANRYGNFSISVYNPTGDKLLGAIILVDAGTYDYAKNEYQAITDGQIAWYNSEIDHLQAIYTEQDENPHEIIPSIVFSHIQLPEFGVAVEKAIANNGAEWVISQDLTDAQITEVKTGGPKTNTGFYDALVAKGSTKAYFVGHAHTFDFQVKMDDIVLGFCPQAGFSKLFEDNDLARNTYVYNVENDFSFTTTECPEVPTNAGLTYSGTIEGTAEFNAETGLYTVKASFILWNRISFAYNGIRLTTNDITVTGLFIAGSAPWDERLYSEDGKKFIYSGGSPRNYIFTYDPNTKTLNIAEEKVNVEDSDPSKLTVTVKNKDAGADAIAVWTKGNIKSAASWIGNGWRYYVVVDAEGRVCYAVVNPPNGYGGPTGNGYYTNSFYSDYTTNPTFEILEGFGPWVQGGNAHNQYNVKVPEGGFALTSHGAGNAQIVNLLSAGTISNMSDEFLNSRGIYSDSLRLSYDATTNEITASFIEE